MFRSFSCFSNDPDFLYEQGVMENPGCKVTVKPVLSDQPKMRPKIGFQDQLSLNAGQSIAECSLGAFCNTFDLH